MIHNLDVYIMSANCAYFWGKKRCWSLSGSEVLGNCLVETDKNWYKWCHLCEWFADFIDHLVTTYLLVDTVWNQFLHGLYM